jgi:O-antigen ligase
MILRRRLSRASRFGAKSLLALALAVAVIFGGASADGFAAHGWILIGAGGLAALSIAFWDFDRPIAGLVWALGFLASFLVLCLIHLVPLPTQLVLDLPGRGVIEEGWALLSISPGSAPLSMDPGRTARALGYLLIPLAAITVVYRLGWSRATTFLPWTIAGLGAASALFGMAQTLIASETDLYLYENTSRGLPVGFFANANHQASFLLMTLPFTAALFGDARSEGLGRDQETARYIIIATLGLAQLVGILAVGSVAGYLLLAPTLLLSLAIMASRRRSYSGRYSFGLAAILLAGIALVFTSPVLEGLGVTSFSTDGMSRFGMAGVARTALEDHIWLGSGIGTFEPVFKLYEDPSTITRTFANHAHNEYLQWALEAGLPGLALLLAFLGWWLVQFFRVWRSVKDDTARIRRGASVVTLIVFLHSFVDYPARTPAILALGTLCLALMIVPRRTRARADKAEPQATQVTL